MTVHVSGRNQHDALRLPHFPLRSSGRRWLWGDTADPRICLGVCRVWARARVVAGNGSVEERLNHKIFDVGAASHADQQVPTLGAGLLTSQNCRSGRQSGVRYLCRKSG